MKPVKKILYFITQSEFGGAQRYVLDLAMNLKNDYEVAVALGEQKNNGKLAKILAENNIKYFIIPHLKRSISPINEVIALIEIIKLIKNYNPDIIHLNSSKISILGSIAAFLIHRFAYSQYSHTIRSIRIIYTVHGWVFNEPLPYWLKQFYKYAEKFTAGFKHKIICVSEYDRQVALKYKIAPAEKLVTIYNGITAINFYDKQQAKELLFAKIANRQSPIANILVGSISNLYKTKGYEYLVNAANILITNYPRPRNARRDKQLPITFLIIGEGSERKNLENLIKKYNLENYFILTGQIDDAAKLLPAFDIYVCSSVKEGLPYSVLEAMQAGLPIVTTNVGGIREMIKDPSTNSGQATGLLVKPAKAQDLANALQKLISDKNLPIELGKNAKQEVGENFGLEKMVEETKKVYLTLLS